MERDERFLEVINKLQITAYTLEKENGVKNAQAKVSHYKNGVTKSISSDIIVGLCEAYPQVNANYIFTGNGAAFIQENTESEENEKDLSELTIRFLSEVNRIGISFYDIAKKTGVKESMFTKIKRGIQEPSKKFLNTFFECYPEIDKVWLLTGEKKDDNLMNVAKNCYSERLLSIIDALGMTDAEIVKEIDSLDKTLMSHIRNGRQGASLNLISSFCERFPLIDANYILTGIGPMFKEEMPSENINKDLQGIQIDNRKQIRHMLDTINEQQKTIENLTDYIKKIESQLKNSMENKKNSRTA